MHRKFIIPESKNGFTLVETIMYVAIVSIVVTSFVSFSLSIAATRNKNYAAEETQANARIIMSYITDKIRESSSVVMPTSGNEAIVLELDMPDTDDNLVFSLENGILSASLGLNTPYFISSSEVEITNLNFVNLARSGEKDNIAIALALNYRYDNTPEFSYFFETQTAVSVK